MQQTNLPKEWEITKFTDFLDIQGGTQPPKSEFIEYKKDGYIRLLQIRDFGSKPVPTYIPFKKTLKTCKKEDLLIARYGASIGRICTGQEGAYNVALAKVISPNDFSVKYIKHYLNSHLFQSPLKLISRSAQNGFNKDDLDDFIFPIPPLSEQTHLANLLDDLTTRVQKIQESLNRIPELLKTFRQSVLARAVSGELTAEWRGTFDYKEKDGFIFSSDWTVSNLGKEFNYGKCQKKNPDEIFSDEWVLELEDIEKDTSKLLVKVYNSERKVKSTKNIFEKGDVLYGKLRPYLNKIILADDNGVCTTEIIPIKTNDKILKNYLFYWLKSPYFSNFVNQLTYGINMPRLGTADGKKILFVYPNLEEQQQIVHQVEHYFALADEIERQTKLAQEKVNYLTQSILAKAFRGELTTNWRAANQTVISGENSAKALLAKIENELKKGKK